MIPQASSGWSALACAITLSSRTREIVSMGCDRNRCSGERLYKARLQYGQPIINMGIPVTSVIRSDVLDHFMEILGNTEADAHRQPYVVERAQPRLGLIGAQPDPAAARRKGLKQHLRGLDLGRPQG